MVFSKRHPLSRKLSVFKRCDSGASAVEFALISTVLAIILLNVIDIGIFMFRKMEITGAGSPEVNLVYNIDGEMIGLNVAVRAGAQYALVDDAATSTLIEAVVQNSTDLTNVTVTVDSTQCGCSDGSALFTCTGGSCGGSTTGRKHYYTQIDATYTHTWIFYAGTIDITASSTIRTQ